jgi:hypothetical protein
MNKTDKTVLVVSLIAAAFLLYMIKPAVANTYCYEWEMDLDDRFTSLDKEFSADPSEKLMLEWTSLQRESLIYETACTDIFIFSSNHNRNITIILGNGAEFGLNCRSPALFLEL